MTHRYHPALQRRRSHTIWHGAIAFGLSVMDDMVKKSIAKYPPTK